MVHDLDYELHCEDREGYLLATVSDTVMQLPDVIDYTNKVMRRFRDGGYKQLIVVRDVPLKMSTFQLKLFGDVIANMLPKDAAMAIVDQTTSFQSTVLVAEEAQRRERHVKAFRSLHDAERWVNEGSDQSSQSVDHGK